jgi:hypothetical protein
MAAAEAAATGKKITPAAGAEEETEQKPAAALGRRSARGGGGDVSRCTTEESVGTELRESQGRRRQQSYARSNVDRVSLDRDLFPPRSDPLFFPLVA